MILSLAAVQVEMRNAKSEEWVEVGESDGPKRFYSQSGLTKGEKYSFRVRYRTISLFNIILQ